MAHETDIVIYRSRLNAKINRNFEVFSAAFLAAITQHIPDKGAQMVRYYGCLALRPLPHAHATWGKPRPPENGKTPQGRRIKYVSFLRNL